MRDHSCSSSALQRVLLFTTLAVLFSSLSVAAAEKRRFDIAAGEAQRTLNEFSHQSELQIYFDADAVRRFMTNAVAGEFDAADALSTMLGGTGLAFEFVNDRTIAITLRREAGHSASEAAPMEYVPVLPAGINAIYADSKDPDAIAEPDEGAGSQSEQSLDVVHGLPQVLVKGSRLLNTDIARTRNDIQPYVVFDRSTIERSGARDAEDFLRTELMMATTSFTISQLPSTQGNSSSIDLRGLGADETLILVDGRRTASYSFSSAVRQGDLNGIPLAAIERIEVLPTTASGIHGGGATGGVINIVLRRDYSGLETRLTYEGSFDEGAANRQIDIVAGFNLGARTSVLLAGSYSSTSDLLIADRDLLQRGREHILANNPSAILSAPTPPLGATTNIQSAQVFNPATGTLVRPPLTLRNGTPLNSTMTSVPEGYAGITADGGAALVANAGTYNLNPSGTAQSAGGGAQGLMNAPTIKSLNATLRRGLTQRVEAFLELSAAENLGRFPFSAASGAFTIPASSPANPFNQSIQVTTPAFGADGTIESEQVSRRALGGFIVKLPANWQSELDFGWSRVRFSNSSPGSLDTATAAAAVTSGTLNVFRDTNAFPADFGAFALTPTTSEPARSTLKNWTAVFGGPLPRFLPGGAPTLAIRLEHRDEDFDDFVQSQSFSRTVLSQTFVPKRAVSVDSAYLESRMPIVSPLNAIPGVRLLELQLAGRWDDYSILSGNRRTSLSQPETTARRKLSSIDPTVGLRYQPIADVMFRASHGTGFLPPGIDQLVPTLPVTITAALSSQFQLRDPLRGNELLGSFTTVAGGNPNLRPEESESMSAGIVLAPRFAEGLRLSVDWVKIDKTDNITTFSTVSPEPLATLITFAPERITRAAVAPGDPFGVGRITAVDGSFINIEKAEIEAYDLAFDYELDTSALGTFGFSATGTRQMHFRTQPAPSSPITERVGIVTNLRWNAGATVAWEHRSWSLAWTSRYFDPYWLNANRSVFPSQGSARIPSQTYHDVAARYRFGGFAASDSEDRGNGVLANTEITIGVKNIFNREPPVDVANGSSGLYSANGDPRLARYYLTLSKAFH